MIARPGRGGIIMKRLTVLLQLGCSWRSGCDEIRNGTSKIIIGKRSHEF